VCCHKFSLYRYNSGCIELSVLEGGELYNGTLTEGLWLMWANEGASTVEQLMLAGTAQLAAAMGCADATELGVTRKAGAVRVGTQLSHSLKPLAWLEILSLASDP
jgi:hypothetical protein